MGIMHCQPTRLPEGYRRRSQFSRTQPAAEWILNTPAAGVDASGLCNLLRRDGMGDGLRQTQRQHLCDFLLAFLIPAELRHAAPVVVERNRQAIVKAASKRKRCREELEQCRIV